jgi:hypothetical protein
MGRSTEAAWVGGRKPVWLEFVNMRKGVVSSDWRDQNQIICHPADFISE